MVLRLPGYSKQSISFPSSQHEPHLVWVSAPGIRLITRIQLVSHWLIGMHAPDWKVVASFRVNIQLLLVEEFQEFSVLGDLIVIKYWYCPGIT